MRYFIKIPFRYLFNEIISRLDLPILSRSIKPLEIGYFAEYPISFRLVDLRMNPIKIKIIVD